MSDFNAYQRSAATTAIYTDKVVYPALGLVGEAGEVANKVKKVLRDKEGVFNEGDRDDIAKELGDVLWYIAALATDMQLSLGYIASQNELKLSKRKANGTIGGSGDNR
jgi:NTP pyrophosphatase (non-canonical NTP hydrolase)|tara:strand:+ start:190 stop:513 length:324 start_codon:yes stop_codon:yes gene_type:complete